MTAVIRKAQPTQSDVHVNQPLTSISIAWLQDQKEFISDQVFPTVPVSKQSDVYYRYNKDDFFRNQAKKRAPSTESAGSGFSIDTAPYSAEVFAFHKDIDDQLRANADSVLQYDSAATEFVQGILRLQEEVAWMATYFTTGVWGTDYTGVASGPTAGQFLRWDDTSSRPRKEIEKGKMAVKRITGKTPNTLTVGSDVFSALTDNAAIRDQFKYTSAESIDESMMARYFGVERFLVSGAVVNSGVEGNATQATDFVAGKSALLSFSPRTPSLMTPSAGYTFRWTGYSGAIMGSRISKFRMDPIKSDRIEGESAYVQKVVAASLGVFYATVVS